MFLIIKILAHIEIIICFNNLFKPSKLDALEDIIRSNEPKRFRYFRIVMRWSANIWRYKQLCTTLFYYPQQLV